MVYFELSEGGMSSNPTEIHIKKKRKESKAKELNKTSKINKFSNPKMTNCINDCIGVLWANFILILSE